MRLDLASPFTLLVLQLAAGGIEGVVNYNVDVFMRMLVIGHPADRDLSARRSHVDHYVVQVALVTVLVRRFDRHAATRDRVIEVLELFSSFADSGLDGWRRLEVVEAYLQWDLHLLNHLHVDRVAQTAMNSIDPSSIADNSIFHVWHE